MQEESIAKILEELGLPDSKMDPLLEMGRIANIREVLGDVHNVADTLDGLDYVALRSLYNCFFIYEEDDDFEGIPDFGPYVIPKEAILAALRSGKPFDIEDYRDMSIPDDAVF